MCWSMETGSDAVTSRRERQGARRVGPQWPVEARPVHSQCTVQCNGMQSARRLLLQDFDARSPFTARCSADVASPQRELIGMI